MSEDWASDKQIQIQVRIGTPDTNVDPEDITGSGWRAGTPDAYRWVFVERSGEGPREQHKTLKESVGWFSSPEDAEKDAIREQEADPGMQGIPIRRIL